MLVLCGKHKRQIGRVVRAVAKADVICFAVCFEQLVRVRANANCAVLTLGKLKKLSLN